MKKISIYFFALIMSLGFLTSCGDKEEVTPTPAGGEIHTYTQILLGGQSNTVDPSFYGARNNTRYKLDAASNNQAAVDLVFAYGSTNLYYIGAPSDEAIQQSHTAVANWTTKNATKFKLTTLTAADFDAVQDDTRIVAESKEATESKVSNLSAGKVFAFETVGGASAKKGLVKVISTDGTDAASRKITFEVKIQK